ncbi:hypothetical protein UM89_11425 [Bacillus subtilis]|nr:hypothetical protein UM89_11425 [Bacillus subtilis]
MQEEQMRASQDAPMNKEENTFPADNGSSLTAVYRKRGMAYYIMVSLIQEGQIQLKSTNEPIKTIRTFTRLPHIKQLWQRKDKKTAAVRERRKRSLLGKRRHRSGRSHGRRGIPLNSSYALEKKQPL